MKKVVVFFIVAMVVFGVCSAQRADAQSTNIAQKIIGTWVDNYGTTWVFNANGTVKRGNDEYKFGVTDTYIVLDERYGTSYRDRGPLPTCYNISISSDGRTLILMVYRNDYVTWLTKK